MKRSILFCFLAISTVFAASCGAPASNTPANAGNANSNANAAKPVAAALTKESLLEMEKKANEAYIKSDGKYFEGILSDKFAMHEMGMRMGKADAVKMIGEGKCDVKSWSLDDQQMANIDADTVVSSYKGTFDGTCISEGQSMKIPSPVRAVSIWSRSGDKWLAVYHGETLIIDPKSPPPPPPKADDKKAPAKAEEKPAANSNAAAPAKPAPDANTDALVKMHQAGWEAFKAKDAKWFNDHLAANFTGVDPMGIWIASKADAIKAWTETMKCEGITKVGVSDGFASAISPTLELLTLKGTADGTCDGQKNGDLYQTAVYVKEGDLWKLAFMFERPAM